MQEVIRVAVDAMGGDNAPGEIVKGAIEAVNTRRGCTGWTAGGYC